MDYFKLKQIANVRKALWPPPICLKIRHKFVKVSPLPFYLEGQWLIKRDPDLLGDGTRETYRTNLTN